MNPLELLLWFAVAYVAIALTIVVVAGYMAWNTLDRADRYKHYRLMQVAPYWPLGILGAVRAIRNDYEHCKDAANEQERRDLVERLGHLERELTKSAELNESAATAWARIEQQHEQQHRQQHAADKGDTTTPDEGAGPTAR